jgi:quercetin dioxygenase-like cupin family protein
MSFEVSSDVSGHPSDGAKRQVAGPLVSFDIPLEIARIRAEPAYVTEGHSAHTLAKYPDLRTVLVAMKTGTKLSIHETAERLALQVIIGSAEVKLRNGESANCPEGTFAALDASLVHQVDCLEDCAFLLTVAWPPERSSRSRDLEPIDL